MRVSSNPQPALVRLAVLAVVAIAALGLLAAIPMTSGPDTPGDTFQWWDAVGTANATMATLRLFGLGAAMWQLVLSSLGVVVVLLDSTRALRFWKRITPHSIRRLVAATVVLSVGSPSLAGAAEAPVRVPVLVDLGPSTTPIAPPLPVLSDIGPTSTRPTADEDAQPSRAFERSEADHPVADTEQWVVRTGDHLWKIAEETLVDRGQSAADRDIRRYWRRMIEQNQDAIGSNPDLIHAGMTLVLPD